VAGFFTFIYDVFYSHILNQYPTFGNINYSKFSCYASDTAIQNRIYEIRGERVMLDRDLATLYGAETKALNLSVKRNIKRFPEDFMFQLTKEEFECLRFQIETLETADSLRSQTVTLENNIPLRPQFATLKTGRGQHSKYMPYAFTEQGVAMLSGILHSDKAINMNIAIMRAFVEVRKIFLQKADFKEQLKEIKERLGDHDAQLNQIYDAMENLLDEKAAERK
jgi:phage regulator Rha-like protein